MIDVMVGLNRSRVRFTYAHKKGTRTVLNHVVSGLNF
jgi:hypothetical protein